MVIDEGRNNRHERLIKKIREIASKHQLIAGDGRVYWTLDALTLCMLDIRIWTLDEVAESLKSGELDDLYRGPQTGFPDSTE